jgi:putative SOS response-associated peptidase YedK
MINARAETLADKPAFRNSLRRRRCLIPADGFYEWRPDPARKKGGKVPTYVRMKDHKPFAFAGLWDNWLDPAGTGTEFRSCTIITTRPNELMADIHDRMPAIIHPEHYRAWLDPAEHDAAEMLQYLGPYPAEEMVAQPVSTLVNSPKNEVPACIEPVEKETLF